MNETKKQLNEKNKKITIIELGYFGWINQAITQKMNKTKKVRYAVFAAELVIGIYNKRYPNNERPREAIEAAKSYLKHPSKRTKKDAIVAAYAAFAAGRAADHDADAAYAAAYSAFILSCDDDAASSCAADAASCASYATYDAFNAADADAVEKQIIEYGISILMED